MGSHELQEKEQTNIARNGNGRRIQTLHTWKEALPPNRRGRASQSPAQQLTRNRSALSQSRAIATAQSWHHDLPSARWQPALATTHHICSNEHSLTSNASLLLWAECWCSFLCRQWGSFPAPSPPLHRRQPAAAALRFSPFTLPPHLTLIPPIVSQRRVLLLFMRTLAVRVSGHRVRGAMRGGDCLRGVPVTAAERRRMGRPRRLHSEWRWRSRRP